MLAPENDPASRRSDVRADRPEANPRRRSILVVHYNNPGAYPPLLRLCRILRGRGHHLTLIGSDDETARAMGVPDDCADRCMLIPAHLRGVRHLAAITRRVIGEMRRCRPDLVYVSDPGACVPVEIARRLCPPTSIVYHEHDSPATRRSASVRSRLNDWARRNIANNSVACVLPNETRGKVLAHDTGTKAPVLTVWNCPSRSEIEAVVRAEKPFQHMRDGAPLSVVYAGSINAERVPTTLVEALQIAPNTQLTLIGYETVSSRGYIDTLRRRADELGVGHRLHVRAPMPHHDLLDELKRHDVCFATVRPDSADINHRFMAGASNKTFEALACGLALIVSDLPDWRETFVDNGVAVACDPRDATTIASALLWFEHHRADRLMDMRARGLNLIESSWNYETQFAKALHMLKSLEI